MAEQREESSEMPAFARARLIALVVSAIIVLPCFWHVHLEAGDLGSHTYNAWLSDLAAKGRAPGLALHSQSYNILFDGMLRVFGQVFGYGPGEKFAVAICVLVFFWGAYGFVRAVIGRHSITAAVLLAVTSYGWTFQAGLMNFYLSLGFMFAALSALRVERASYRRWIPLLVVMMWLSHPLGVIGFVAFAAFDFLSRRLSIAGGFALAAFAGVLIFSGRVFLASHARVGYSTDPLLLRTGLDQWMLYGMSYRYLGLVACVLGLAGVVRVGIRLRGAAVELRRSAAYLSQLYLIVFAAVCLLPDVVQLPGPVGPFALLTSRTTTLLMVFGTALLLVTDETRLERFAWPALALVFFAMLFHDTGELSDLEERAHAQVVQIPPGSRVTTTVFPHVASRLEHLHAFDRACIGRCFVVNDYEPLMNQFRLRLVAPSPIIYPDAVAVDEMQAGRYIVQPQDLPLYSIHPCAPEAMDRVCIDSLQAGDRNGFPARKLR